MNAYSVGIALQFQIRPYPWPLIFDAIMKPTEPTLNIFKKTSMGGVWTLIALCFGLIASTSSHAGKYVLHKDLELVLDTTSGLIWERCPIGMKTYRSWFTFCGDETNKENTSLPTLSTFKNAANAPPDWSEDFPSHLRGGWRLPTAREWINLMDCPTGFSKTLDVGDGLPMVQHACKDWIFQNVRDTNTFPFNTAIAFWSSTPVLSKGGQPTGDQWLISLERGALFSSADKKEKSHAVVMVRSSELKTPHAIADAGFTRKVETLKEEEARQAKVKLEIEEEEERKAQARRAQAAQKRQNVLNTLLGAGAQSVYLQAGKAEREGSFQFQGEYFGAKELYEALIAKFPTSPFAAKANDQLLANQREGNARSMLEDARYEQGRRAYEACKIEMDACYLRNNYKGTCWRDCDKLR